MNTPDRGSAEPLQERSRKEAKSPGFGTTDTAAIREILDRMRRVEIGCFPTPVFHVDVDGRGGFWVKDDGSCSVVYGGNKVRKLEYLFGLAKRTGKNRLVVQGGTRSHTTLACALHAAGAGIEVLAVVYPPRGSKTSECVDHRLLASGAKVVVTRSFLSMVVHARILSCRPGTLLVPFGCTLPLTTLGYVRAGLELCDQIQQGLLPDPDLLFVAHASGGTVAGLLVGLSLGGSQCRVVAVQTVEAIISSRRRLEKLVKGTLQLLTESDALLPSVMQRLEGIETRYLGEGYFSRCREADQAVDRLSDLRFRLDPIFTGKAMAAMLAAMGRSPAKRYLFWNTNDHGRSEGSMGTAIGWQGGAA